MRACLWPLVAGGIDQRRNPLAAIFVHAGIAIPSVAHRTRPVKLQGAARLWGNLTLLAARSLPALCPGC